MYFIISITLLSILFIISKKYSKAKKWLIITNIIISMIYLIWRKTTISKNINIILGLILLLAEIIGILRFYFVQFLLTRNIKIKRKTLNDFKENIPSVDILICTYNESEKLLEKTIIGALNLEYEKSKLKIYVCDDGNRKNIKKLCDYCGVNYISRSTNEGAKAGNINNALLKTYSELFVVLDADMVCTKEFLKNTVGYFSKKETAFVQTPQVFYNKDIYQKNLKKNNIPNEQDFFMRDIQQGRAALNSVLHVGTNAVFRREYIKNIGYYPTDSITEDMAVGIKLQSKGFKTIFINEILVFGLSASTYTDMAIQRDRWCRGNIQVIKNFKPFKKNNLNILQKLVYLDGTVYWFTCFQKLIYLMCPIIFLFTTQKSIDTSLKNLITFFIPYLIGLIFIYNIIIPNTRSLKWAHIYDISMFPHTCMSIVKEIFSSNIDFIVTPKTENNEKAFFQFNIIIPHIILSILSMMSWITGIIYLHYNLISLSSFILNMLWSIYNFLGIITCIRVAYHIENIEKENYAVIESGYKILFYKNNKDKNEGTILSVSEMNMNIRCLDLEKHNYKIGDSIKIIINKDKIDFTIHGHIIKLYDNKILIKYNNLTLEQKKLILGIYLENLKPVYDVGNKQQYL